MDMLGIPIWGQMSFLGLSLGLNVFFIIQIARGIIVPYNRVEDANKNTDRWQKAWEIGEQTKHEATALLGQLTITALTMEKVLNALPLAQTAQITVVRSEDAEK